MDSTILVIDDEQHFLDSVRRVLNTAGFRDVELETDPANAIAIFERGDPIDLALIDVSMPGISGIEVLESIMRTSPDTECLMITAVNDAKIAVQCIKKGAYDYLLKPISRDDLVLAVNRALERKRLLRALDIKKTSDVSHLKCVEAFEPILTRSINLLRIMKEAELHAVSNVPVLITGESGTGKELLARAIHDASPRAKHLFTPVNMAGLTGTLFDSEFFGHTKGAFTGAEHDRKGYLETANRGTLFLDEIGHLPLELQGKLLRVLQDGEFLKVGASHFQKTDIRFIAATNIELDPLIAKGKFRKDLFYRLKGAWLHLPPLRERREDIPLLIDTFMDEFEGTNKNKGIDEQALSLLIDYDYPGNIRELRSIIQSSINLAQGRRISEAFLPEFLLKRKKGLKNKIPEQNGSIPPLEEIEKDHILKAYDYSGKNKALTARLLGIGLNTLRRKLNHYRVD
jgi:two-component system response regulator AtoC